METDNGRKSASRYRNILFLIFLAAVTIVVKMGFVMFAERSYWMDVADNLVKWNKTIDARRGNILSDEGLLMASSMPQYRIFLDFKSSERGELNEKDQHRKDTLFQNYLRPSAEALHGLFPDISAERFISYYMEGHSKQSHYYALMPDGRALTYNQFKEAVVAVPWLSVRYDGWFYSKTGTVSRKKPFGTLATRTLGDLYGAKDSARYGLELSFDSILRGKPGVGHEERFRNTSRIITDTAQVDGCDIVTTLNVQMQDIAETALRRRMQELTDMNFRAVSGVAVLMEVATGDVKAMTSLTRTESGGYYEIQNNVVKEVYEPGSTFKTVSMMVALDDGRITMEDSVYCEMGQYSGFGGVRMTDSHNEGWLTTMEVLKESSNIGTSKLIAPQYKGHEDEFVEAVCKTGINTHFDMQLTGTAAPVIRKGGYWDATRLPWMTFGYNVQLPVINTLAFYNGIANGGRMVAPRLVTEVRKEGRVLKEYPVTTVTEHMCKESTLKDIRYMLEQVVLDGTGKQAGSKFFQSAGKTGTAQISQGASGYTSGGRTYLASFCGYFPADKPVYSCIVAIKTSIASGAGAAGPVFKEISEKVMSATGERSLEEAVDTLHPSMPHVLNGDLKKAEKVLKALKLKHYVQDDIELEDSVWGSSRTRNDSIIFTVRDYRSGLVPNVVGMGASDAVYLLEKAGLKVGLTGVGRVYSQSLTSGSRYNKGDYILLKLRM